MRRFAAILFLLGASASLEAQQPFLTDDPNVTPRGKVHFEGYNQFAVLPVAARPGLSQDTTNLVLQYGLLERVEVNVDIPLLLIVNDRGAANAFGLGDLDFAVKVRILDETPGTLWPAFAVTVAVELPTGIASRGLGSGYTDFGVNTIYQKTVGKGTTLQANLGYQFNGNTLTGDIGIRTPGRILSGGISVEHDTSPSLRLGLDLNGALIKDTGPGGRQLQLTPAATMLCPKTRRWTSRWRPAGSEARDSRFSSVSPKGSELSFRRPTAPPAGRARRRRARRSSGGARPERAERKPCRRHGDRCVPTRTARRECRTPPRRGR